MAIVQISQITNRKGLAENLPQLAGAELGWSTDTRQLYIGNGTLEEGAPVVGNTEILTEFSDILNLSTTYTYKGEVAGYTVQTGPTAGTPVTLSLQQWLDQFASVLDFGAVGDGLTDDTDAINRALFQLFCREANPQIRRSLFFPAGVYRVTQSINIPPYATLWGEGIENSIIQLDIGDDSTLHECVARSADSLQQVGVNIGSGGATPPTNVTIVNMGFRSLDPTVDVFIVECATNYKFSNVSFAGPLTTADLTSSAANTQAIAFRSTVAYVCDQIVFDGCKFFGATYGTNAAEEMRSATFTNGQFDTLYQGIVVNGSITGMRITGNQFDNIYAEGIIFGSVGLNASGHNIFYDVGNHFGGPTNPNRPIISIQSNNNVSISDMFERADAFATVWPRVDLTETQSIATVNGRSLSLGSFTTQSAESANLNDSESSPVPIFVMPVVVGNLVVRYTLQGGSGGGANRTGTLTIASNSVSGVSYTDDYTENAVTAINFSVTESSGIITVSYTSGPYGAIMRYSISYISSFIS